MFTLNFSCLDFGPTFITVELRTRNMHIGIVLVGRFLQVLRFELTMLIVAVGLLDGDGDGIENVCGLLEDSVHLLQGAIPGFGEEEVHNGEDECVSVAVSLSLGGIDSDQKSYMTAKMI